MTIEVEERTENLARSMFNPGPGDFVLGYGFFEIPIAANVMMLAWERDGQLMACKRLRIFVDDKAHDSEDKRQFITMTPKEPMDRETWWAYLVKMFEELRDTAPTPPPGVEPPIYIVRRVFGDLDAWMKMFAAESFTHIRMVPMSSDEEVDTAVPKPGVN